MPQTALVPAGTDGDSPERNTLLRDLPAAEYDRIGAALVFMPLPVDTVLYEPDKAIAFVHFPLSGVLSLLALAARRAMEVGTIGNEGMSGLAVFHGMKSAPQRCFTQVEGSALRLPAGHFLREIRSMPCLSGRIHRYAQAFFNDVAQSVACNHLHTLEQRCARWLLMTQDRVQDDEFVLTQRFLSLMLGSRRESVSAAASSLRKRGCIEYSRGRIEVTDRPGLESASCSCYRTTRSAYNAIAGEA